VAGQEWQDTSRLAAPAVPCPYSLAPRSSLRRPTLSKRTRTTWERVAALWGRSSPDLSTFPLIHSAATTDGATGELVHLLVREFDREGREQLVNIVEPLGGGGSLWPWGRRGLGAVEYIVQSGRRKKRAAFSHKTLQLVVFGLRIHRRRQGGKRGAFRPCNKTGRRRISVLSPVLSPARQRPVLYGGD